MAARRSAAPGAENAKGEGPAGEGGRARPGGEGRGGARGRSGAPGAGAEAAGARPRNHGATAGRPRSEEAHQAILDATLALLAEQGFSALTVEGVAARAGVGKATIYRRWSSKLPLVVEAFSRLPALEDVDTGSLEGDLTAMLRSYLELFERTPLGAVLPSLVGERAHNPELGKLFDPVVRTRRRPLIAALERAIARGELPPDLDKDLAADLIVGPIAVRLFFSGAKVSPRMVEPMIEMALEGVRRGGGRSQG